jgi:hypothetical protein
MTYIHQHKDGLVLPHPGGWQIARRGKDGDGTWVLGQVFGTRAAAERQLEAEYVAPVPRNLSR